MKGLRILAIVLSLLLILSVVINIYQWGNPRTERITTVRVDRDTIVESVYSTDTIYLHRFTTIPSDTVYRYITHNDSVFIHDEPRDFVDSTKDYTLTANAVKLNWYKLSVHKCDTITIHDTKEILAVPKKQSRWGFGLFAGPSYDIYNRQWGVSVGAGLTFRIK